MNRTVFEDLLKSTEDLRKANETLRKVLAETLSLAIARAYVVVELVCEKHGEEGRVVAAREISNLLDYPINAAQKQVESFWEARR